MSQRMTWDRLLSSQRFRDSHVNETSDDTASRKKNGRTAFQKDIDRITFSSSFRRLGRKTQVHLLSENDHIHTRLSHSLEVACVGRSLGVKVGHWLKHDREEPLAGDAKEFSPSDIGEIVQAACLAHDIGNPPFGHAAEDAIRKWFQEWTDSAPARWKERFKPAEMQDLKCFDGNAAAFRVVTHKEFYGSQGGMRLTYATLGSLLKYPWTSHFAAPKNKFSCFKTEYDNLCEIAGELGLIEKTRNTDEYKAKYARHPLAYLVEAADDICYHVLDIEDAVELHLLSDDTLEKRFRKLLDNELDIEQQRLLEGSSASWRTKNGLLRGKMIGRMIEEVTQVFISHHDTIMEGRFEGSLFSKTDGNSLCLELKNVYDQEKLDKKIYQNQRNVPLELGAYSVLNTLLTASAEAACEIVEGKHLSYKTEIIQRFMKHDTKAYFGGKTLYEAIMLFLDYVTGMTDEYATSVNRQLLGLGN